MEPKVKDVLNTIWSLWQRCNVYTKPRYIKVSPELWEALQEIPLKKTDEEKQFERASGIPIFNRFHGPYLVRSDELTGICFELIWRKEEPNEETKEAANKVE